MAIPASFREVAAAALAASFVIRAPEAETGAGDRPSIQSARDDDEDVQEDGWEPLDPVAALRHRTLGAGVVIDPRGIALTSARVILRARQLEVAMMDGTVVNATGAVARDIDPWSPAARAGLKSGDVILEVDGQPIRSPGDFQALARAMGRGVPVLMRVQRGDLVLYVVVDTVS